MSLYQIIWYNCQFWLPPKERRPFTFMFRDFYHEHPIFTLWIVGIIGYAFGEYLFSLRDMIVGSLFLLLGHLFWGKTYVPNEQEQPEYDPNGKSCIKRPVRRF